MIRIGIVGTGSMAKERLRSFSRIDDVCVKSVYSRNKEKASDFIDGAEITAYDNYSQMLDSVDAVVLCLPNGLHTQFAKEALLAECHVLVEYPLAINMEDAVMLSSISLEYSRVLMTGNTIIHESLFKYITENQGRLGEIISASSRVSFYNNDISDSWFYDCQRLGPVFAGLHYHHIEYYKSLLGPPLWVLGCDESVNDNSGQHGKFVGGTVIMGHDSRKTSCIQWYLSASGSGLSRVILLNGTTGSLTLLSLGKGITEALWNQGSTNFGTDNIQEDWGVNGSSEDFIKAIKGALDHRKRFNNDMQTLSFALAAQDSAIRGHMVHLD